MSYFRVCMKKVGQKEFIKNMKFDNKDDAEHYAKNQSVADNKHVYEVQKNNNGDFSTIKSYLNGQEE
jgi:hypothetical protein